MFVANLAKAASLSDVTTAQALVHDVWAVRPGRNAEASIFDIFAAVKRIERALPRDALRGRPRQWTERRVRAIWKGEARRIDNYEMVDLENAALETARVEHRESIRRSERMARFISAIEEARHRSSPLRVREMV